MIEVRQGLASVESSEVVGAGVAAAGVVMAVGLGFVAGVDCSRYLRTPRVLVWAEILETSGMEWKLPESSGIEWKIPETTGNYRNRVESSGNYRNGQVGFLDLGKHLWREIRKSYSTQFRLIPLDSTRFQSTPIPLNSTRFHLIPLHSFLFHLTLFQLLECGGWEGRTGRESGWIICLAGIYWKLPAPTGMLLPRPAYRYKARCVAGDGA